MNKNKYISPQTTLIEIKTGNILDGSGLTVNDTLPGDGNTVVMTKGNGSYNIWDDDED